MNNPWRPAAAQIPNADSAASNSSSFPSDRLAAKNLPITVGIVASRISFLQRLAGNQKNKSPPKTPPEFPHTRSISNTRRERSNRSPPQSRPPLNRRREHSRSSFGRRPTNIFGNPASRNSQPNEQLHTGTNHSFLGLQTTRLNHDEGHARADYRGTPRIDGCIGPPPGGLRGMVQADAPTSGWAPIIESLKTPNKSRNQKTPRHKVDIHRGFQRLKDTFMSTQLPPTPQVSNKQNRVSSPHRQKKLPHQCELANSETSVHTTSTLRRQSVRDLFDTYNIERPVGLASSEVVHGVNKSQRHRVCHLCMWIHDKNENTCWKCGHRLCKACDRLLPSSKGGKDVNFDYNQVLSGTRPEPLKTGPYITTPRPARGQITKLLRPLPLPSETVKKVDQQFIPTEPFPPFYPKKSPPQNSPKAGHGPTSAPGRLLHSCPGIYIPEYSRKLMSKPDDASQPQRLHSITESLCQHITNEHRSESQSSQMYDCRCDSCQAIDDGSFICRHPTSPSLARSDDVVAMNGGYTTDNGNNENIYRSRSHPNPSKFVDSSTRLHRLLKGSIHRSTQLCHDSDHREIPRTSMRSCQFAGPVHRNTQLSHELDHEDHAKTTRPSTDSYRVLNRSTYRPTQPNYESDHIEDSKLLDNFYPFFNGPIRGAVQSNNRSDYVECRGYPRTGHGHCDRSPVDSGILGDCQHCLDDCECSACQSTVHSVRCCTNEVHKPMIHLHRSPAKTSLNASNVSDIGHSSLEQKRKPYILSRSQTYDRSTLHKYDNVSEWLESPDDLSLQRPDSPIVTPTKAVHASKAVPSIAVGKASNSSSIPQTQSTCAPSLGPMISNDTVPLIKKALNQVSQDAVSKAGINPNRASSSDGTKDQSMAPVRSSSRFPTNSSPGYFASNPWRQQEAVSFPRSYSFWKQMSNSPLQQVSRRSTDCETSDVCGQSEWAEQRLKSSESISRQKSKGRFEQEQVRKKVHQWEDRRSETRRGRDTIITTTSEMATPSGGYFDAHMRRCSSGSVQKKRYEVQGGMGSIVEEDGEEEVVDDDDDDDDVTHDCIWRRAMDIDEGGRYHESRDEGPGGTEGIGVVKGVTVLIHMEIGEDLVLRTNMEGELSWEGLDRLMRIGRGVGGIR
ncbi:hypothetical protein SBOR_8334 [Sclerotinia borealis F-4128]|uniref:Uncharacterized protein n=1 Tax=Sclerotinia borealis (strain F-4128) TaxID=1432307 RepID=W9C8U8_SCLBF|nr:hypothetical protein SBOR_8334 [Sclerotinia borealis F-4128]